MSAAEVLQLAHDHGVRLTVAGNDLLLEAAAEPPAAMLNLVRKHKSDLILALTAGRSDAELIQGAFREGKSVKVWSGVLQEWIWWAPSEETAKRKKAETDEVVYHKGELIALLGKDQQFLKDMHELKKALDGEIIE